VSTTTTVNPSTGSGSYYTPPSTSTTTHVSSTTYHRYWLRTLEGKQTWLKFSDHEVLASVGHKLSSIWSSSNQVLMAYNHATGTFVSPKWWSQAVHTPPYWRTICLTMLLCLAVTGLGVAGIALGTGLTEENLEEHIAFAMRLGWALLIPALFLLMMYAGIVSAVITTRRQNHFRKQVAPRYEAFLRSYDPEIPEVTKD
jgi:hypothetical protein